MSFKKFMSTLAIVLVVIFVLFIYNSYAANNKVERQKYNLIKVADGFEIRYYPKAIMATVATKGHKNNKNANQNFRTLAGYIFGGNKGAQKISMTAPVYMERDTDVNRMSFVLPSGYTINELPNPNDSAIKIHYSDDGYFAALSFRGFAGEHKIVKKENELKQLLKKNGYATIGKFSYLGYNAPWEIINRQNDIVVKIEYIQ